jgi:hypothetical protein
MNKLNHVSTINAANVVFQQLRQKIMGECDLLTISKGFILKRKTRHPRYYTSEDASKLTAIDGGSLLVVRR